MTEIRFFQQDIDDMFAKLDAKVSRDRSRKAGGDEYYIVEFLENIVLDLKRVLCYFIGELASEYYLLRLPENAEAWIRFLVSVDSEDPLSWIMLAHHQCEHQGLPQEALASLVRAAESAARTGRFFIQANLEIARIGRKLDDKDLVESALKRIIDYIPPSNSTDSSYDISFVRSLLDAGISRELIEDYVARFG